MKLSTLILTIVLVAFFSTACTATGESKSTGSGDKVAAVTASRTSASSSGNTRNEYETALAEAKAAQKKAASVGGEWRDIGKFLKQADLEAGAGNYDKAIKLVNKAKFQAEAGYQQALDQKNASPNF